LRCEAASAARGALYAWHSLSGHARARYLYALARLVQKHARRLAVLETMDNGKPIRESRDIDIPFGRADILPPCRMGSTSRQEFPVTRLAAWWDRYSMELSAVELAWKIAPALAAGNTIVLKPRNLRRLLLWLLRKFARKPVCLPAW